MFLLFAQAPDRQSCPASNVKRRKSARAFPGVSLSNCRTLTGRAEPNRYEVPGPALGH